jgi:hypothetical protein
MAMPTIPNMSFRFIEFSASERRPVRGFHETAAF